VIDLRQARGARPVIRARQPERGAALLLAVVLTAVLTVIAGTVATLAVLDARAGHAARAHVEAADAVRAGLDVALAWLVREPDLDAVRAGLVTAPSNGAPTIDTPDGVVDVAALAAALARERGRLPPPADGAEWQPYLWGRLGEVLATPVGTPTDDALIVVFVRGDAGAALGPDRLELAAAAVRPDGARAGAVAGAGRLGAGLALEAVWMDGGAGGSP
jgi:hypothetical protein